MSKNIGGEHYNISRTKKLENKKPEPQEIIPGATYRHFKGEKYKVLHIVTHSETQEKMVVYIALYDDYEMYARPLSMFASWVDRIGYSGWRFEKLK